MEIKHKITNETILKIKSTDLCEADLYGANLCGAYLRGANLCGAKLNIDQQEDLLRSVGVILS